MTDLRRHCRMVLPTLLAIALPACSGKVEESTTPRPEPAGATASTKAPGNTFAAPSDLKAVMPDQHNVDLHWKYNAAAPGGCFVEFIINPEDTYTILDILSSEKTTFRHPDLAPETHFTYRARPFFGKPADVASVQTRTPGPSDPPPTTRVKGEFLGTPSPDAEGPLEEPPNPPADTTPKKSLKDPATFADAAPSDFTATLATATAVDLRWKDRASDEDGYIVEVSADNKDFKACALLPADSTSFRKSSLPPDLKCYFRVRAFFSGTPSNTASITTGPESARAKTELKTGQ